MKEILNKIFSIKNLHLKLISLLLATGIWLLIAGEQKSIAFYTIPLEVRNLPEDFAILGNPTEKVTLRVRASEAVINSVRQGDIGAFIDLSDSRPGEQFLPVEEENIRLPFGMELVEATPSRLLLNLDRITEKMVDVRPTLEGEPAEGFRAEKVVLQPEKARVKGGESVLADVEFLRTETIKIGGISENMEASAKVIAEEPKIELIGPAKIQVTIEIAEITKKKTLEKIPVQVTGAAYRTAINPRHIKVTVEGPFTLVNALSEPDITVVLDVSELEPRATDYLIEPTIRFNEKFQGVTVLSKSQRHINVHIYPSRLE